MPLLDRLPALFFEFRLNKKSLPYLRLDSVPGCPLSHETDNTDIKSDYLCKNNTSINNNECL